MSANRKRIKTTDPNFEECVQKWIEECDSDCSDLDGDPDSNITVENVVSSDHETASELSGDDSDYQEEMQITESEDDEDTTEPGTKYFYGKNRYKWAAAEPTRNVRTPAHNLLKLPGNKNASSKIVPLEAWQTIFSQDMLDTVVRYTNLKIQEFRDKPGNQNRTEYRETNCIEINGLLGLLLLTAVFKSNNEAIESIYSTDGTGREIFRLVMSAKRFAVLLACLRFDTHAERILKVKTDPAAAISHIFDKFNQNSQSAYTLGANATVDEMLVGFRGRCKFKMYLPSKPVKYGLKIQCLVDARTHFICNTYIYCGKGSDSLGLTDEEKRFAIPTQAVLRLSKPLFGSNRNITGDNWYSSIELTDQLLKKKLTYVGTMRKNKREIPKEFLPSKTRQVGSTLYGFTCNKTLISRVPKKSKAVILISSMHHCRQDDGDLPEINAFYNNTKSGVDAVDEKTTKYSCSRRTQRWPMALFYRIVDMSSVNAYIINQSCANAKQTDRLNFLKLLAKQLYEPLLQERSQNAHLPREIKNGIFRILKMSPQTPADDHDILPRNQRKYCSLCDPNLKRKTGYLCVQCRKPICLQCSKKICDQCLVNLEDS